MFVVRQGSCRARIDPDSMSYVRFDPENGDLSLTLAAADHRFQGELYRLLTERFLETEFSEATLAAMDRYVEEWLQQRKDRPRP